MQSVLLYFFFVISCTVVYLTNSLSILRPGSWHRISAQKRSTKDDSPRVEVPSTERKETDKEIDADSFREAYADNLTSKLMGVLSDDEDVDTFDLIAEKAMDQSLEKAVKQMVGEPSTSSTQSDPVEKFNAIYRGLKARKNSKNEIQKTMSASEMLLELFPVEEARDPFDEKKVITKLRQMLDAEDFKGLFQDANVGDLY